MNVALAVSPGKSVTCGTDFAEVLIFPCFVTERSLHDLWFLCVGQNRRIPGTHRPASSARRTSLILADLRIPVILPIPARSLPTWSPEREEKEGTGRAGRRFRRAGGIVLRVVPLDDVVRQPRGSARGASAEKLPLYLKPVGPPRRVSAYREYELSVVTGARSCFGVATRPFQEACA